LALVDFLSGGHPYLPLHHSIDHPQVGLPLGKTALGQLAKKPKGQREEKTILRVAAITANREHQE
jgi:hypothetical protein